MYTKSTYAYRDTLIGPNAIEITRGITGGYSWSAHTYDNRLIVEVRKAGATSALTVERAPNYVMAAIARAMTFASDAAIATNESNKKA